MAAVYRAKLANLHAALADPSCRTEATEIIRRLIERMDIHPTDGKGFEIGLTGDIAAMIDLGAKCQKTAPGGAAVPDTYRSSVNLVAGRGFEPLTFRL